MNTLRVTDLQHEKTNNNYGCMTSKLRIAAVDGKWKNTCTKSGQKCAI